MKMILMVYKTIAPFSNVKNVKKRNLKKKLKYISKKGTVNFFM